MNDTAQISRSYKLTIDLNVLEHLGINLYSNVPAVLTEITANAWDADATEVIIKVSSDLSEISITDNGVGMDSVSINNNFLTVGYRRREDRSRNDADRTARGRPVMGRKGVGKLAPFSIADTVEVFSTKDGERNALRMRVSDIREKAATKQDYHPEPIDTNECPPTNGTKIVLKDLHKERIRIENLVQRLARRFSVIGTEEFSVKISKGNEEPRNVTMRDRGDLEKLQYLWTIGDWQKPDWLSSIERETRLLDRLETWPPEWKVTGWLGTAKKPKDLDSSTGNLNVVVILARGRLFHENILSDVSDGRHYIKYLVGQIEADFLDDSNQRDIATSDRQRIQEDDVRFQALRAYLKKMLTTIEANWSEWRPEDSSGRFEEQHPQLVEWIASMRSSYQVHAKRLIGRIASLDLETEIEERTLLKHAILGFERLRISGSVQELSDALSVGADKLLPLLADIDSIEDSLYSDIVRGRLQVIQAFESKVENDELEKILQEYLFEHLWLLDPAFERAQGSEIIEAPIVREFEKINASLSPEEKRGRVDIKYRSLVGKHVIIELKRAGRTVSAQELLQQGMKYRNALLKCLKAQGRDNEPFEFIFIVGKPLLEESYPDPNRVIGSVLQALCGRVMLFSQLIASAREAYREYLVARERASRIRQLIDSL